MLAAYPGALVRRLDPIARGSDVYRFDSFGTRVAYVELYGPTGELQQIKFADLARPDEPVQIVDDQSKSGGNVTSPVTNGQTVLWTAFRANGSGFDWQIRSHDVERGTTETLVEGENRHRRGPTGVPTLALAGHLLAYTIQAEGSAQRDSEKIVVVDLTSGDEVRDVPIDGLVWDIAISQAGDVIYSAGRGSDGQIVDTRVTFARADGQSFDLGPEGYEVSIDQDRLAWVASARVTTNDTEALGQLTMTATVDDPVAHAVTEPQHLAGCPPICAILGSRWPAAGDGLIAWEATSATIYPSLMVWDTATDREASVLTGGSTFATSIGDGWLVTVTAPLHPTDFGATIVAISVDDIRRELSKLT